MIETFLSGGFMMWPMLAVLMGIAFLGARAARMLHAGSATPEDVRRALRTILFWGVMGVLLGLLGTAVGLIMIAKYIEAAGSVASGILWSGIGVALVTTVFGILIFLFAATIWLVLHTWSGRLPHSEASYGT